MQTKRKLHSRSFSLRTMFVGVTTLAIILGWFVWRVQRQKAAARAIQASGGFIAYDDEAGSHWLDDYGDLPADRRQPRAPAWLINLFGKDFFHSVVEADAIEGQSRLLKDFPNLRIVFLNYAVTDEDIAELQACRELRFLYAGDVPAESADLTDRSLRTLSSLSKLRYITVQYGRFTDVGVQELNRLDNLERLSLGSSSSELTQRSIERLREKSKLQMITIVKMREKKEEVVFFRLPGKESE